MPQRFKQSGVTVRSARARWIEVAFSLPCKTVLLFGILLVSVVGAVSGYFLQATVDMAQEVRSEELISIARGAANSVAGPITERSVSAMQAIADGAVRDGSLAYFTVHSPDGVEVVHASERHRGSVQPESLEGDALRGRILGAPQFIESTPGAEAVLEIVFPVSVREGSSDGAHPLRLVGYVRIGATTDGWQNLLHDRLDLMIGVGVLAALVAAPLGTYLVRRVVSPLDHLGVQMMRFSEGDWNARCDIHRRDEIGRLAASFNTMADQHQSAHERLVLLNNQLEQRVAVRTMQLREQAVREPLTGLFNRRYFNEVIQSRLSEAQRYDADLSCAMIDLDEFKKINDQLGHQTGDAVLIFAAQVIRNELRAADVAARFGGDEFVLLLPQTDMSNAEVLAQRIVASFAAQAAQRFPSSQLAMSIGVASLRSLGLATSDDLLRAADHALYLAKRTGKGKVVAHASAVVSSA